MRFPGPAAALFAPLLLLAGCGEAPREIAVENAWIRMPAVAGRPGAAYFTIRGGKDAALLESVGSPQIERIELHDSRMQGGVSRMAPLGDLTVPAGAEIKFEPGGKHAMLFGMAERIEAGGQVPIHFRFSGGQEAKTVAHVVAAGESAPDHAGH